MGLSSGKEDSTASTQAPLYVETPLIYSKFMSDVISRPVHLKLENAQPSGSFKHRGISANCQKRVEEGCTKLVGSSGGNAGLALAYAAMQLNVPCQLFVPTYVSERMLNKIKAYGTEVTIVGKDWQEADEQAKLAATDPTVGYVHPFDDPAVWEGNSSMVQEVQEQLNGVKPSCIVASVGGGGLLTGILLGLEKAGWKDVPVIAIETFGSECFNLSIAAGELVSITLTSICKTLGARAVTPKLMEIRNDFNIISHVLHDKEAVEACLKFADDHAILVEPSCGATLATVYSKHLPALLDENAAGANNGGPCVLVVCGGSDTTPEILNDFAKQFDLV